MNGWTRLGIALSGVWALFLLGAMQLSFRGRVYSPWDYVLALLATLALFWLVGLVTREVVIWVWKGLKKEKGNGKRDD